jgi:hypothetical protein
MRERTYIVVPAPGCYSSSDKIYPEARGDFFQCHKIARRMTHQYLKRCREVFPHTTGGFRVVRDKGCDWYFGHELDGIAGIL